MLCFTKITNPIFYSDVFIKQILWQMNDLSCWKKHYWFFYLNYFFWFLKFFFMQMFLLWKMNAVSFFDFIDVQIWFFKNHLWFLFINFFECKFVLLNHRHRRSRKTSKLADNDWKSTKIGDMHSLTVGLPHVFEIHSTFSRFFSFYLWQNAYLNIFLIFVFMIFYFL